MATTKIPVYGVWDKEEEALAHAVKAIEGEFFTTAQQAERDSFVKNAKKELEIEVSVHRIRPGFDREAMRKRLEASRESAVRDAVVRIKYTVMGNVSENEVRALAEKAVRNLEHVVLAGIPY